MSGDTDKLAQTADWAEAWLTGSRKRDVLALVEIAKAARETLDDNTLPRLDSPNRARLRAALSALDGET